jgi:hypothetical protein
MFAPHREEVPEGSKKLHGDEFYDLQPSPNIFMKTKLRRTRYLCHVICMGKKRNYYHDVAEKLEGTGPDGRGGGGFYNTTSILYLNNINGKRKS